MEEGKIRDGDEGGLAIPCENVPFHLCCVPMSVCLCVFVLPGSGESTYSTEVPNLHLMRGNKK